MREDATTNRTRGRSASPVRLPPRPTRLIGREAEVAALQDLLTRDDIRLVTITGPPGVGKTRLAIEVAASTLQFSHGIVFVDLAQGLSNRAIAQRLFISERTADTHVQHILNKLGFNSRTQIAAWTVQQGLVPPQ